jgi:hypothetical protein
LDDPGTAKPEEALLLSQIRQLTPEQQSALAAFLKTI